MTRVHLSAFLRVDSPCPVLVPDGALHARATVSCKTSQKHVLRWCRTCGALSRAGTADWMNGGSDESKEEGEDGRESNEEEDIV